MLTLPSSLFTFRKIALAAVSFMSLASLAVAAPPHAETNPFERSTFSDDWGVLSNDIFFGGVEALFGLSPASRTPRLSETTESKTTSESYAIVNAAGSSENLFSFAAAVASPFAMGRTGGGPAPNATTAVIEWANVASPWSDGANWIGGNPPSSSTAAAGDIATFGSAGSTPVNPTGGSTSVSGVSFLSGAFSYNIGVSFLLVGANGITNSATNTQTVSSTVRISTSETFTTNVGGSTVFNGIVDLNHNAATARTLTVDGAGNTTFNGAVQNSEAGSTGNLTKTGAGTLTLSGNNTYTGATTINGGTLSASGGGSNQSLGGTSGVTVNSGGTLLQTTSNQINNGANVTLNSGTYRLDGGVSEGTTGVAGLGSLTLASNSIINLAGTDLLHFDASGLATWAPGSVLSIYNWNGTPVTGGGAEQILFGTGPTGLNALQLVRIQFYSGEGTGAFAPGAVILANGEIVPVPEPSTWIGAALALAALVFMQRRARPASGNLRSFAARVPRQS